MCSGIPLYLSGRDIGPTRALDLPRDLYGYAVIYRLRDDFGYICPACASKPENRPNIVRGELIYAEDLARPDALRCDECGEPMA